MQNISFYSRIIGGCLHRYTQSNINTLFQSLEGQLIKITIEKKKNLRSVKQNSFYWGVVIPWVVTFFQEYGNNFDAMQVHEYLKSEVGKLDQIVDLPTGIARISGNTHKMSTKEFEDYLTKIRAWGAEWGLTIPLPNENSR